MTNAELIEKLRILQNKNSLSLYKREVCRDAADALEAAEQRIAELEKEHNKTVTAIFGEEQLWWENRCKELEAQIPKEGEWIDEQRGRWIYAKCNLCGKVQDVRSNYCPNCGAKMRGVNDE